MFLVQGSHFSGLTKFQDFSRITLVFQVEWEPRCGLLSVQQYVCDIVCDFYVLESYFAKTATSLKFLDGSNEIAKYFCLTSEHFILFTHKEKGLPAIKDGVVVFNASSNVKWLKTVPA